jgi:hypothetical protein
MVKLLEVIQGETETAPHLFIVGIVSQSASHPHCSVAMEKRRDREGRVDFKRGVTAVCLSVYWHPCCHSLLQLELDVKEASERRRDAG